jgi:pyruvate/2-oxoglutarate dehydrogenase complex dihydrolipoamide acyltransferase (E2) component
MATAARRRTGSTIATVAVIRPSQRPASGLSRQATTAAPPAHQLCRFRRAAAAMTAAAKPSAKVTRPPSTLWKTPTPKIAAPARGRRVPSNRIGAAAQAAMPASAADSPTPNSAMMNGLATE